jgi:hypothetical protein
MNPREKRLAFILGVAAAAFIGYQMVWPAIQSSVFAVDDDIKELKDDVFDLEEDIEAVASYRDAYRDYVARTGVTEPAKVKSVLHARLTKLIEQAGLRDYSVTPKKNRELRPPKDLRLKKDIKIELVGFSINADGELDNIIRFLKDFYELPYIAYLTSVTIDPPTQRSKERGMTTSRLILTVDAVVPPAFDPEVSEVNPALLEQPARVVKHRNSDYNYIAERRPFDEYVPPPPELWACCTGAGQCAERTEAQCQAARGSFYEGQTCSQVRGKEEACTPPIACCVNDECLELSEEDCQARGGEVQRGRSSCRNVQCKEPEPVAVVPPPPPPPPPVGDPDRDKKVIEMTMQYGSDEYRIGEIVVVNQQSGERDYVPSGGELDAGEVLLVHARGAVTLREDDNKFRVYAIGRKLADCVMLEDAIEDHPEIYFTFLPIMRQIESNRADADAAERPGPTDALNINGEGPTGAANNKNNKSEPVAKPPETIKPLEQVRKPENTAPPEDGDKQEDRDKTPSPPKRIQAPNDSNPESDPKKPSNQTPPSKRPATPFSKPDAKPPSKPAVGENAPGKAASHANIANMSIESLGAVLAHLNPKPNTTPAGTRGARIERINARTGATNL